MSLKQFPVTVVWNHSISWISCDINNFCFLGFSLFWKHFIWKVGLDQSWFILWKVFYKIDWVIWWWLWQQFFLRKLFINISMHEKMSDSTPLIGICHKYKYFNCDIITCVPVQRWKLNFGIITEIRKTYLRPDFWLLMPFILCSKYQLGIIGKEKLNWWLMEHTHLHTVLVLFWFSLRIYVSISWPDCQKVFSCPRMDSYY